MGGLSYGRDSRRRALCKAGGDGENHVRAQVTGVHREKDAGTKNDCKGVEYDHFEIPLVTEGRLSPQCFVSASRKRRMVSFTEALPVITQLL